MQLFSRPERTTGSLARGSAAHLEWVFSEAASLFWSSCSAFFRGTTTGTISGVLFCYHINRPTMIPCQRPVPMSENDPRVPLKVPKAEGSAALNVELGGLKLWYL